MQASKSSAWCYPVDSCITGMSIGAKKIHYRLSGPDYMFRLIYSTLLHSSEWDHVNAVVFFDAAFTSVKLVRELHDNRGIYAVGPTNAGKGKGPNSWPLQTFKYADTKYLQRGWDRVALSPLDRGGWLQVCNMHDILALTHALTHTQIPHTHSMTGSCLA